jgi:hypothetical protein
VAKAQLDKIVSAANKFGLPAIAIGSGAFILESAFKGGSLTRHPSEKKYRDLDPSLALAKLMRTSYLRAG